MSNAEAVIQEALAKIEASGEAWAAMRDKVQSDPLYGALMSYSKSLAQTITRSGWEGHGQMIAQLTSSQHYRGKRASALAIAREGQVRGLPGYASAWLKRAAALRKSEHSCRETERAFTLTEATNAFCETLMARHVRVAAE